MKTSKIKKLVLENSEYKCSECGLNEWNNKPITLELDHIDGNNRNNEINNLRFLCPNCHSQTSNFRGRNKNSGKIKVSDKELLEAIESTSSIRQALIKVNLTPKGLNYRRVSKLYNKSNKVKDVNNSQYGTVWINNGNKNLKVKKDILDEYLNNGYKIGRLADSYVVPSNKGKIWVTNGLDCKMVYPDDIPSGYFKGKFQMPL